MARSLNYLGYYVNSVDKDNSKLVSKYEYF